ncbi:unnamed protein product [Nesidiocoris tenuis]|uniref:Uncharacterized protein n=1 Tax=Nesidiocoris tenuis TaxID=355587 RepID=A0A6H5GDC3_9HEMI|nr:unnamed protein product [Nesidiocoris tenuis]
MEQKLKLIIEIEVKLTMEQKLKLKTDIEVELAYYLLARKKRQGNCQKTRIEYLERKRMKAFRLKGVQDPLNRVGRQNSRNVKDFITRSVEVQSGRMGIEWLYERARYTTAAFYERAMRRSAAAVSMQQLLKQSIVTRWHFTRSLIQTATQCCRSTFLVTMATVDHKPTMERYQLSMEEDGKSENSLQQWRVIGIDLLRSDSQGGPISSTNSSASLGAWCHRDASASTAGTGSTSGGGTWQPPPGGHPTQNCTLFNFDILKLGLSSRSKGKLKLNLIMKRRLILKPKRQGACPERLIRFTPTFSRVSVSCPPRRIRHRRLVFLPFDAGSD